MLPSPGSKVLYKPLAGEPFEAILLELEAGSDPIFATLTIRGSTRHYVKMGTDTDEWQPVEPKPVQYTRQVTPAKDEGLLDFINARVDKELERAKASRTGAQVHEALLHAGLYVEHLLIMEALSFGLCPRQADPLMMRTLVEKGLVTKNASPFATAHDYRLTPSGFTIVDRCLAYSGLTR